MDEVLLLAAAVLPVVIGLIAASRPVSTGRVQRFCVRHRLDATADQRAAIKVYLFRTRRYRTLGVLCGYLVSLAAYLPQQRLNANFALLLAGWLGGAALAENRPRSVSRAVPAAGVVPGWLLRVPLVAAVVAVAVTGLLFAVAPDRSPVGQIVLLGASAVLTAGAAAVGQRRALRRAERGASDAGATDPARAEAANSVGAITGVGVVLAAGCLAMELQVLGVRLYDFTATAAAGIGLLWTFGSIVVAALVASAAWPAAPPAPPSARRSPWPAVAAATLLAVASAGWAGYGWWQDHPPYGPDAIRATATIRLTDEAGFDKDAQAMGVSGLTGLVATPDWQQFVGRVDYTVPPGALPGARYEVVVINKRDDRAAPQIFGPDGGGWHGAYSQLPERYPWLSALAPAGQLDDGQSRAGPHSVSAPADAPGPIVFVGTFPDTVGLTADDLMVVLFHVGPDTQIYWATPVPTTA